MTAQEAYDHHRHRAFRDPDDDEVTAVFWADDPLEVVAIVAEAVRFQTPEEAWSNATSPAGHKMLDALWCHKSPESRQLLRRRAAMLLLATGTVRAA
jgi:hypothetical protein